MSTWPAHTAQFSPAQFSWLSSRGERIHGSVQDEIETHTCVEDLAISFDAIRLELAIRGVYSTEIVGLLPPSFNYADLGSFSAGLRGRWCLSFRSMGLVGRSVGFVLLPGGVRANAGWSRAFDIDSSAPHLPQDLTVSGAFRGSTEFSRWRIPALEVLISGTNSSPPVGLHIAALLSALAESNAPDPRFILQLSGRTQVLDDAPDPQGDENLKLAVTLSPVGGCDATCSQRLGSLPLFAEQIH